MTTSLKYGFCKKSLQKNPYIRGWEAKKKRTLSYKKKGNKFDQWKSLSSFFKYPRLAVDEGH